MWQMTGGFGLLWQVLFAFARMRHNSLSLPAQLSALTGNSIPAPFLFFHLTQPALFSNAFLCIPPA